MNGVQLLWPSALRVDVLTANLRLLPLLLRRFEIADVMMLRPYIRVVREADGESNWTPFIDTIARTMKPGAENQVSFSEIRIQDGVLNYEDPTNHVSEVLGDIDLSLAWPSISRSFAATGQFDWRGERVDGSISVSDFVAALAGDRSGLKARLVSAPLKLAFDGTVANRTSAMMEGTLTVDSISLRNALHRLVRLVQQQKKGGDPILRQKLAALWIGEQALQLNGYRSLTKILRGGAPGPEGSTSKLFWSQLDQELALVGTEVIGPYSQIAHGSSWAPDDGQWEFYELLARASGIRAGTSEILRNILAERVLGLPKD